MTGPKQGLYAILDTIAQSIVQNVITISRHEAPMVRMFTDLLGGRGPIAEHPADYALVRIAVIDDDHNITGFDKPHIVLTGAQWAKLHQQAQENHAPVNNIADDIQSAQRRALEARR